MTTPTDIQQSNARLKFAIVCYRMDRNPASKSEIYDAINARQTMRHAQLTPSESNALRLAYLRENAPDLLNFR